MGLRPAIEERVNFQKNTVAKRNLQFPNAGMNALPAGCMSLVMHENNPAPLRFKVHGDFPQLF